MFCRNCGKEISEDAVQCPKCGYQLQYVRKMSFKKKVAIVLATVFMAVVIFGAVSIITEDVIEDTMKSYEHQRQHKFRFKHDNRYYENRR